MRYRCQSCRQTFYAPKGPALPCPRCFSPQTAEYKGVPRGLAPRTVTLAPPPEPRGTPLGPWPTPHLPPRLWVKRLLGDAVARVCNAPTPRGPCVLFHGHDGPHK